MAPQNIFFHVYKHDPWMLRKMLRSLLTNWDMKISKIIKPCIAKFALGITKHRSFELRIAIPLLSLVQKKVYQYYIITYSMSQVKVFCTISPDSLLRAHGTTKLGHNIKHHYSYV